MSHKTISDSHFKWNWPHQFLFWHHNSSMRKCQEYKSWRKITSKLFNVFFFWREVLLPCWLSTVCILCNKSSFFHSNIILRWHPCKYKYNKSKWSNCGLRHGYKDCVFTFKNGRSIFLSRAQASASGVFV